MSFKNVCSGSGGVKKDVAECCNELLTCLLQGYEPKSDEMAILK
jgi:hypothetical protein